MAESLSSTRDEAVVAEAADYAVKFYDLGMLAEAEKLFAAILTARPDHFDALHGLGILRQRQGNGIEALRLIGEALKANSRSADSTRSFGAVLETLDRHEEALALYDKALAMRKERCEALVSHGVALVSLRRLQEALTAFDEALEIKPDHLIALSNRAMALVMLGRHRPALDACDRILAVNPRDAEAFYIRGHSLWSLDRAEEALESYQQAWALGHTRSLSMLALYRLTIADWARAGELANVLSQRIAEGDFIYPFTAVVFGLHPLDQLKAATNYLRICLPNAPKPLAHPAAVRSDKLRIAYLSSDFRQHAVALAIAELIERHDRARFEIIGVSLSPDDGSEVRARIVSAVDRFHDVSSDSDENVAKLLHSLEIHIAVDLNGPTQGSRPGILAYRPASVQVAYLGYPATTGADFIDYILADETVLAFDQQPFFTEKIVQLPDCYHANDTTRHVSPQTPERRALGLPDQGLVFCCFNKSSKLSAPVFGVWMRLLARVPGSVLWLSGMNKSAQANLRREAAARGVDPERLIFASFAGRIEDHLARQRAADLFLDTLPYNAHSTACDALWVGLPVVTCAGASFAGRVAASMLKAAGLPELVTASLEDYEALALELATDRHRLSSIRQKLADQRPTCPLFDGDRFRRHVEAAYTAMWDIHRRGEHPRGFRVEPSA